MKILVLDGVSEKGIQILREPGFEVDVISEKLTEDQLAGMIDKYNGVIVRSAKNITTKILEKASNLTVIGRAGVGVDNIDVDAATDKGIIVINAPNGNTIAATEHTMALILAVSRFVPQANENLKKGKWLRKEYTGVELKDKTLGIIGLGRIGTAVAKRAQGFEMKVIGYDPFMSPERAETLGIELMDIDEIIKTADFITVHLPLTKETKNLIDEKAFSKMKKGVRIVNAARGGIINETALYNAVKEGIVAGAAIDVFETEPMTENPLFELDNVVVTPHLGASTKEAQINVALDVAHEMVAILKGEMAKNAVNVPALSPEVFASIKPYLSLAEKLGNFAAQMAHDIDTIEINYSGELAKYTTSPITTMILKGILNTLLYQTVSIVNAGSLAKDRGIKIVESKTEDAEDYTNLISIKVKSSKGERKIAGTSFGHQEPRIVIIDDYHVDAVLEGNLIVIPHYDKPKVIGSIGILLGEYGINIASLQVDRKAVGGIAIMLLKVDNIVSKEVIESIKNVSGVIEVDFINLEKEMV